MVIGTNGSVAFQKQEIATLDKFFHHTPEILRCTGNGGIPKNLIRKERVGSLRVRRRNKQYSSKPCQTKSRQQITADPPVPIILVAFQIQDTGFERVFFFIFQKWMLLPVPRVQVDKNHRD